MKLVELNPSWCVAWGVDASRHGMGVSFDCPHCVAGTALDWKRRPFRIRVWFENPIDGFAPKSPDAILWKRVGEAFETLTLDPSIDASGFGHWHGYVRCGELVP